MEQVRSKNLTLGLVFTSLLLPSCANWSGLPTRSMFGQQEVESLSVEGAKSPALAGELSNGERSITIDTLLSRRSILAPGPYTIVADAVLATNSRAAEADLRAAVLRSEARELNWLPSLGPQISLTSLGAVVASIVVEQVLFDNGAKRADREYARADVEVAAVALAKDTNQRVYQALSLYLDSDAARARAAISQTAMSRMKRLEFIMAERVSAGVDDRTDLQFVQQRLGQMRSDLATDREREQTALAELSTMSAAQLSSLTGILPLADPTKNAVPLAVMKAEVEASRSAAKARAARSGFLPGLSLGGAVGNQSREVALTSAAPNGIRFGLGRELAAIEAQEQATAARVAQQREDSSREISGLYSQLTSLERQAAEAEGLARQARANYDLFEEQLRAGQRRVPEVVAAFQTTVNAERSLIDLTYDAVRIRLRLSEIFGTLVDGERI